MGWKTASIKELEDVKSFLIKEEWRAVVVSDYYKNLQKNLLFPFNYKMDFFINKKNNLIKDLLLFNSKGLVYPVFTSSSIDKDELRKKIDFNGKFIHSVMGMSQEINNVVPLINKAIRYEVDYDLLGLDKDDYSYNKNSISDIKIKKARPSDKDKLYPLQRDYELEEVYLEPENFRSYACLVNLKNKLTEQKIYYVDQNGPVAKAGTNARGFYVDQIGGVFTVKDQRNKGYSTLLMSKILKKLFKTKNQIVLFVKKENMSAQRVYSKLNFKAIGHFKIVYF